MPIVPIQVSFAEGEATAKLAGFFPVAVKSGEQEQVQHWIEFEVSLGNEVEKKHLVLIDSLLEDFRRRSGFSVLDDEEFMSRLFVTRFEGTPWNAVDLVVRPSDLESVISQVGN